MAIDVSRERTLESLAGRARVRERAVVAALAAPWIATTAAAIWQVSSHWVTTLLVAGLLAALALTIGELRSRRFNTAWLARKLDAHVPEMEDSSALLTRSKDALPRLAALQAQRLDARLARLTLPDFRTRWPRSALLVSWIAAAVIVGLIFSVRIAVPEPGAIASAAPSAPATNAAVQARLVRARLKIEPPAYTGLPARAVEGLTARVPAGSKLQWSLRVAPSPTTLRIESPDGRHLPLLLAAADWHARTTLDRSMLYRVVAEGLPTLDPRLHRIVAIPDRTPRVRVTTPSRTLTLTLATPGQRSLALDFDVTDDYGIGGARLTITLAQGSGENIGVRAQTLRIGHSGSDTRRRYRHSLDLAALGMQPGDDLIAQLHVEDNRKPKSQRARSASVILRWPLPPSEESSGMEGLVQRVLPAYFRSQRQIIIDSEALLKERGSLAAARFVERSDSIGVDQRVLRLRYGQFLGEEAESGSRSGDVGAARAPDAHATDGQAADAVRQGSQPDSLFADAHAHHEDEKQATPLHKDSDGVGAPHDDHAQANPSNAARFGDASAITAEFGHTHDIAEAATLLDPATQKLLRAALNEMWQAELHLRQGFPDRALPFEHKALEYIKKVQQADRIYLAKVGFEIPPIDESRRLTGKREGLHDRTDVLAKAPAVDQALLALWAELGQAAGNDDRLTTALADAENGLVSRPFPSDETLDAVAALDAVRRDRNCAACRQRLRASLWPLLPRTAAHVSRRESADPLERAYLDAITPAEHP